MCKRLIFSVLVLLFAFVTYTSAGIVYVDATDGDLGNTALAAGGVFTAVDVGTSGSGADGLWRVRAFANAGTIFESGGDWAGDGNTEDCPRLVTMVAVPEDDYNVYVYFWADGDQWRIQAALADAVGDLPMYLANDPNGEATVAVAEDFEEPVPMLTEDNQTLWQVNLGTTGVTNMISVYVDDEPNHLNGARRTWYDGIGYEVAAEPVPEVPCPVDPGIECLVAYYALENDMNDSSGNELHGTFMGDPNTGEPKFVAGHDGMALDLDGIDDYVDCGYDPLFDVTTNEMTVAAWVNIRACTNAWQVIAAKGEYAWRLSTMNLDPSFHFGITWWASAADTYGVNGATAVNLNEWYHVAGVFDGTNIDIYLDGALDGSEPTTETIGINDESMLIGNNPWDLIRWWDGLIDEVTVYDCALSEYEIMYLAGIEPEPVDPGTEGLVAYYALENDANDSSGNGLHGTLETIGDGNAATFVAGHNGMAIDLLPSADGAEGPYVNCGNSSLFDFTDAMTVGAWVNIRSTPDVWRAIIAKGDETWRLATYDTTTGFQFAFGGSGRSWPGANSVTQVGFDEWHCVYGTYDTIEGGKIYIDGVLDGTNPNLDGIDVDESEVWIGGNNCGWMPYRCFDGMIDEVRLYDRALSECEILYLAERPCLPVHSYTFEDGTANDSVGDADGILVGDANIVDGALVTTAQDQWMEMPGDVIDINSFDAITIEAWYTPTANANTGWSMLAYFGDSTDPDPSAGVGNDGFFMTSARGDDKSRAAISVGEDAAPYNVESGADGPEYDDGLLHHMVCTISDTDIALYIDGVLQASTPLSETNKLSGVSNNYALLAKGGYGGDPEWIGQINEFNIYDCALSEAQVADKYAAGLDE